MAKKVMKKYQGNTGSSSVNPIIDSQKRNVAIANDKAAKEAADRNKKSTAPDSLFKSPSATSRFSSAAKRAVKNLASEFTRAKKGGTIKKKK